nr:hypothetical protein [uncultured Campylobacter sp.]
MELGLRHGDKFRRVKFSLGVLVKFNQNQTSFDDLSASRPPKNLKNA